MDKSWMLLQNRFCKEYKDGAMSFIEFARTHSGEDMEIKCPCSNCCNHFKHKYETVYAHLLRKGMQASYTTWDRHGEPIKRHVPAEGYDENDEDEKKSETGKRARASHKYNHTGGSRSYASRSSMEVAKNGGVLPSMIDIFEITHKRHRHGGVWINELAEQDHALLKEKIDAQSQPNTENPQTEVQISVEVLGKRSSFFRGFGKIKTTSSSRQSQATSHKLTALQKKFADQQQKLDDQQQKLDAQQQKLADQDNSLMELRSLLQMMAAKFGMDPSTVRGLVIHNGSEDHTSSGGHDATSLC